MQSGDYVLATKWKDGEPGDHWCVGLYSHSSGDRHFVTDIDGNTMRYNGFRRVMKVSTKRGLWILSNSRNIEEGNKSLWWWVRQKMS